MKGLSNCGNFIKRHALKSALKVQKHSPELLLIAGSITFVATVIVACNKTLKCEEVIADHERRLKNIDDALEISQEDVAETGGEPSYTEDNAKKDRAYALLQTGFGFTKLYFPAILLGLFSISFFLMSYGIMRKRNIAWGMAYGILEKSFNDYRSRVRNELGESTDEFFRYGYKKVNIGKVLSVDENGEPAVIEMKDIDTVPWDEGDGVLDNATFVFAPETSKYFRPSEVLNDLSIDMARNNAQTDFELYGILFLNDVLDKLGIKKVPYGQKVGWRKGCGDPYVDFRTKKVYRKLPQYDPIRNPLCAEYECVYEFDFNTCGEVWQYL